MASQTKAPSPATRAKQIVVDQQLDAIKADGYRITLLDPTGVLPPINIGKNKGPDGGEKLYTADEVKKKIGYLSAKNSQGYNVYITPEDEKNHYMLIDDLDRDKARQFWKWGYRPTLVQYSSQESIQAVCIMPKADVSHGAGNALFLRLNRRIGDPNISAFRHAFRLAGFGNKKESRRLENGMSPLVALVYAEHHEDRKATEEARAIDAEVKEDERQATGTAPASDVPVTRDVVGDIDVAAYRSWYQRRLDFWGDGADLSKIDRQLARRLRNQGYSEGAAIAILLAVSPDIEKRHPRIEEYIRGKVADIWAAPAEPGVSGVQPAPVSASIMKPR